MAPIVILGVCLLLGSFGVAYPEDGVLISGFESNDEIMPDWCERTGQWRSRGGVRLILSFQHVTQAARSMQVELPCTSSYPGWDYFLREEEKDWSKALSLNFDILNPQDENVKMWLKIQGLKDDTKSFGLNPKEMNSISINLSKEENLKNVTYLYFYLVEPKKEYTFFIDNLRLVYPEGQSPPTKIKKEGETKLEGDKSSSESGDLVRSRKAIEAVRASAPPEIDGRLNDISWKESSHISGFVSIQGKPDITQQTTVKILYDDNCLYFGFELFDSQISNIMANVTEHDKQVWDDDCIEIYLDPGNKRGNYYHFLVTSLGIKGEEYWREVQKGLRIMELSWDPDWQAVVSKGDKSWFVEVAIPCNILEIDKSVGSTWGINFTRHQISRNELSCLFPTYGGFHRPDKFGDLIGLKADLDPYRYRLTDLSFGEKIVGDNELSFRLTNETVSQRELRVKVDLTEPTGEKVTETQDVSLGKGEERRIVILYRLKGRGEQGLQITLLDPLTKRLYYASSHHKFSPPLPMTLNVTRPNYANSIFADQDIKEIVGKVYLNIEKDIYRRGRLEVELKEGEEVLSRTVKSNLGRVNEFSFDVRELKTGKYRIKLVLLDKDGTKLAEVEQDLHKLPPASAGSEVRIDEDNNIIINRKPFFPIGIWWPDESDEVFREISEAGFNTVMIQDAFVWRQDNETRMLVEKLEKYGLRLVDRGAIAENLRKPESLKSYISKTKNFSPLLAWFSADEPEDDVPSLVVPLTDKRKIIKEEDPYHPVYINMAFPNAVGDFASATDVTGFDYYPCYEREGDCMEAMSSYAGRMRQAIKSINDEQPIWLIAQLHPHLRYVTGFHQRPDRIPNFSEQRCMVYQSIIHGAKGIFWFVYQFMGIDKITNHPWEWYALKALTKEMETLSPVFLSPTSQKEVMVSPRDDDTHLMLKDYKEESYFFAVSTGKSPKTLTFNIPALQDKKKLKVVSENREIELINGKFQDTFEKYAVHIYTTSQEVHQIRTIAEIERERERIYSEYQKTTAGNIILEHFLKGEIKLTASSFVEETDLYYVSPWFAIDGLESTSWGGYGTDNGPQWLEIDFGKDVEIGRIVNKTMIGSLRDYEVQYWEKDKWVTIDTVKGNTEKLITHSFVPVKVEKLRILVTSNNGQRTVINEVEAYRK